MKLIRDKKDKSVVVFWDDEYDHLDVMMQVVVKPEQDLFDMPNEKEKDFMNKLKKKTTDGKVGKIFFNGQGLQMDMDDGTGDPVLLAQEVSMADVVVEAPKVKVEGVLEELEQIRLTLGKKDNEAITFGDVKNLHGKVKKEKYDRI